MRNQHQADRQHPKTNHRKKPEQAANDAENAQGQPPTASRGVARPADGSAQADVLFQPIERAIEQVAGVVVTIVDHTKQGLPALRCSARADCQLGHRENDPHRAVRFTARPAQESERAAQSELPRGADAGAFAERQDLVPVLRAISRRVIWPVGRGPARGSVVPDLRLHVLRELGQVQPAAEGAPRVHDRDLAQGVRRAGQDFRHRRRVRRLAEREGFEPSMGF